MGVSRDLPHDSVQPAEHSRGLTVDSSWDPVNSHTDQRWVKLSPMNSDTVFVERTSARTKATSPTLLGTITTSEHSTSGEENKLDYLSRSTVNDVAENVGERVSDNLRS